MKRIIKQLFDRKSALTAIPASDCNFTNNYYGDQLCRKVTPLNQRTR